MEADGNFELHKQKETESESDREKINVLITKLEEVGKWLTGTFDAYRRYQEALNHPLSANLYQERQELISSVPDYRSPFEESSPPLEPKLYDSFANYCLKNKYHVNLSEFINELNDFIQHKGTGEIGAFKLYDSLNKLFFALKRFNIYLINPKPVMGPDSLKEPHPWHRINSIPIGKRETKPKKRKNNFS